MEKTKSATIYLPDGDVERYEEGIGGVKEIHLFNNNAISIIYESDREIIYSGMPFVYNIRS